MTKDLKEAPLKILFISSEVTPFSRTSEVGDVAGSLTKALRVCGHEVRLVTPQYRTIRERRFGIRDVTRLSSLQIEIGEHSVECAVKSGFVTGSKVQVYFINNQQLYTKPISDEDCVNNNNKQSNCPSAYALLNHTALQLMIMLNWIPDIIHCNGWQTAITPYLLKYDPRYKDVYNQTRTTLHIHNIENQGLFTIDTASEIGVDQKLIKPDNPLYCGNNLSFLKAGLSTSDLIIAANPSVNIEINSPDFSPECGIAQVITNRKNNFYNIFNGIDPAIWNPSTDKNISKKYTIEEIEDSKAVNKETLLEKTGLPVEPDIPLIGVIADLIDEDDFNKLVEIEADLFSLPAAFLFLCTGESICKPIIQSFKEKYPEKVVYILARDKKQEHELIAGSDILLMPSCCVLSRYYRMYSLTYGTVPVAKSIDNESETVVDCTQDSEGGNGFTFIEKDKDGMLKTLRQALDYYKDKPAWYKLCCRGMSADFSWNGVGEKVVELYKEVLSI
ncbi:MAG: glycogen/starch synthase [Candidatus Hatepunaea meridiana]|nr:glycogen/starch synthase [Candidatus Hatepunaea meridiana]